MDNIGNILSKYKKIPKKDFKERPRNPLFEQSEEFGKYVGLSTPFVMRLCKIYGAGHVFGLRSFLADIPYDPKKGLAGLVVWKLKQLYPNARKQTPS